MDDQTPGSGRTAIVGKDCTVDQHEISSALSCIKLHDVHLLLNCFVTTWIKTPQVLLMKGEISGSVSTEGTVDLQLCFWCSEKKGVNSTLWSLIVNAPVFG